MNLRAKLTDINDRIVTIKWRQGKCPSDDLIESVAQMQFWVLAYDQEIVSKFQSAKSVELLEKWSQSKVELSVISTPEWCFLEVNWRFHIKMPFQIDMNIQDNFILFVAMLTTYNTEHLKKYLSTYEAEDPFQEEIAKIISPAIWVWTKYHMFIFQAASENFSVNPDFLDTEHFQNRLSSWYKVISDISSNLQMFPLRILDSISTMVNISPFILDSKADSISLHPEVLKILDTATKLYESIKNSSQESQGFQSDLSLLVQKYTWNIELYIEIMEIITKEIEKQFRALQGCPAHWIDINWVSLFKNFFSTTIKSAKIYYTHFFDRMSELHKIPQGKNVIQESNNDSKASMMLSQIVADEVI